MPNWTSIKIEWCRNWIPETLGPPKEITQETKVQFPFVSPTPIISQKKRKRKRHGNPPQPNDQTIKPQHSITFHCLLVVFVHKTLNSFSWIRILVAPFCGFCQSLSLCWGFDNHNQLVEEKRRKIMASDTKRGSVSRLSPLAKPFILKTPKNSSSALNSSLQDTSLSPSSSRLAQSFSSFSVEGDSFSYYSLNPSRVYQGSADFGLFNESKSDLDALLVSKSAELGYKAHNSGDHQEILHWKDKHDGFSMSNDDPTKQGVL